MTLQRTGKENFSSAGPFLNAERAQRACEMLARWAEAAGIERLELARIESGIRMSAGLEERPSINPLQYPDIYFPGLTAKPWHDPHDFAATGALQESCRIIKEELVNLGAADILKSHPNNVGYTEAGEWTQYHLYCAGEKLIDNCSRFPETTRIIESVVGACTAGFVYFSGLPSGTHLRAHCGEHNIRLRLHLGLIVQPECQIRVGTEIRSWEAGACIVFDDSFEHEVWNNSEITRIVLIVDLWHPDLTRTEIMALEYLITRLQIYQDRRAYLET